MNPLLEIAKGDLDILCSAIDVPADDLFLLSLFGRSSRDVA
jgi:hypothetical protein